MRDYLKALAPLALLLIVGLSTASFAQQPDAAQGTMPPTITLPAPLARLVSDFEKTYLAKDGSAADLFLENGVEMLPNRFPVVGRAELRKFFTGSGSQLHFHPFAYGMSGDVAWILGGYSSATNPGPPDGSKFTFTLKKDASGAWKMMSAMPSSNRPAAPPPPAQ